MSKSAVIKMAYENNGIVTSSMVSEANLSRNYLSQLVKDNKLEKVSTWCIYVAGSMGR